MEAVRRKQNAPAGLETGRGAESLPPRGNIRRKSLHTKYCNMRQNNSPHTQPGTSYLPGNIPVAQVSRKRRAKIQIAGLTLCEMEIADAVCAAYTVTFGELSGKRKTDEVMNARCAQTAYMYHERGLGKRQIARALHLHETSTGIRNRLDRHEALLFTSLDYRERYKLLCMLMQVDNNENDSETVQSIGGNSGLH